MKGQSAVETSLVQALFSKVKPIIRAEVVKLLKEIKEKVDEADLEIDDLNLDHFIDRLVIYIFCGGNMLLCAVTIYLFLRVRRDIIGRIDTVMRQAGVHMKERRPLLGAPLPANPGRSTVALSRARSPASTLPLGIRNQGIAGPSHGRTGQ